MDIQVSRIDLQKTADNWPPDMPFKPALLIKRPTMHPEEWLVADAPLMPGTPPNWVSTLHDQYVRIPVFPYELSSQADVALADVLRLGLSCAGNLPARVKKCHVVTGSPVDLLYDEAINTNVGIRCWLGVAIVIEKGV